MSKRVNLIGNAQGKVIEQKMKPIHNVLDEYRNDVLAIHKAGFTWEQTAQQVNEAFGLKGDKRMTQRSISQLVKKWQSLNWIDSVKVEALAKEITQAGQGNVKPKELNEAAKVVPTTTFEAPKSSAISVSSKPNYQSMNWQNGTYTDKNEFITEIKDTMTAGHSFNQAIADEVWSVYLGKSRKLVMNSYTNKAIDSAKR